jgi:hypothetical protein
MAFCVPDPAQAQSSPSLIDRKPIHIPAQPLSSALRELGQLFAANISANDDEVAGRSARTLRFLPYRWSGGPAGHRRKALRPRNKASVACFLVPTSL